MVSNAALTSRETRTVDEPWSIEWKMRSRVNSRAVSVEWNRQKADWKGLKLVEKILFLNAN